MTNKLTARETLLIVATQIREEAIEMQIEAMELMERAAKIQLVAENGTDISVENILAQCREQDLVDFEVEAISGAVDPCAN